MSAESISYSFEDFYFDADSEQLFKNGSPVPLTVKAVNVLRILVQNHGKFVGKEEIIERVWSNGFVEEANLTQHIRVLRKTLGQTADGQPLIETVPKRGYRFTAPITERKAEIPYRNSDSDRQSERSPGNINQISAEERDNQIPSEKTTGYKFDNFKLDIQRRMLYRGDQPIALPAKAFETLLFLVENSGRLVKKDELMDRIWHERFVEENNLTQKIFILRRVLGDIKNAHRYIVTVPGDGYVFVAPVVKYSNEIVADAAASGLSAPPAAKKKIFIAVLPFKWIGNQQQSDDKDFTEIGLTDAIISQLSRYRELIVHSTSAVMKFHNQEWENLSVSRNLQATHLAEGIIQKIDSKLKISVQLFESESGGIVWADDFVHEDNGDILEIQNQFSSLISKALALELNFKPLPGESNLPQNFEAFQEYIKGKFYWNSRTIEGLKKGIAYAQNVLAIDPTYAMAYVGLADCYNLLAGQHSFLSPKDAFPKAKAASQRALEISDGRLAEAYASLGFTTFYFEWNRPLARKYFQKAIELKPNYPTSYHWYGESLAAEGNFDESIEVLKKAQELDPLSSAISNDLAKVFLFAGRIEESRLLLDQILELNPRFVRALYLKGQISEQLKEFDRAVEILESVVEIAPDEPAVWSELGCAAAFAGNESKARQIIKNLEDASRNRYLSGFLIARIYLALQQKDEVFKWLEIALQNRDVALAWIDVLPGQKALREDEKFVSFVTKVKKHFL
jgi:DNA-binding winged helix-turn-helix (wHTH) protein/tetratricopeptide (TPR) repeat protein